MALPNCYSRQVGGDWRRVSDDVIHGQFDDAFLHEGVFETLAVGVHQNTGSDDAKTLEPESLLGRVLAVVPNEGNPGKK